MPYIPAQPDTFFIRSGQHYPVVAWNITATHTCPVTSHVTPLGLVAGDAVRFPEGNVMDLYSGTLFADADEWADNRDSSHDGQPLDGKTGPGKPKHRASGPRPVGPFGTVFAGKTYQRWSNWLLNVKSGPVVMELPPNTKSPTNDFAERINREQAAEYLTEGARKMSYQAVSGLEELPDEPDTDNEDEDEDDLEDLV